MLTLITYLLHVIVGTEDSVLIRGVINQVVMASTIIIWNANNKELWSFTNDCFKKE